jgi:hypothetical protein
MYIPSEYEACGDISFETNIKALVLHIGIYLNTRIPLPEIYTLNGRLEYLLYDILEPPHKLGSLSLHLLMLELLLIQENHFDLLLEDIVVAGVDGVVLDGPDEPPGGVAGVVAGSLPVVQQVWDQGVP